MHSVANIIVKTKIQYAPTNRNETFSEFTQGKSQFLTHQHKHRVHDINFN